MLALYIVTWLFVPPTNLIFATILVGLPGARSDSTLATTKTLTVMASLAHIAALGVLAEMTWT
jgi:hypothetical protein